MGLDSKKDVHLDGSTTGSVSRLEVLEGPSGRRVRSEAERVRIVAESLLPGAQVSEVARKHGATRWQIYDWRRRFRREACCRRARRRSRHSRRWSWKVRWRSVRFRRAPAMGN
ncbi:transposase [Bradyrhizobium sp. 143]|uniref:transposase n=1 Tax=Bradyrhizobium sp. 143 TaxID=2782619 RepID=UPI001FFBCC47|nr:transposase [Bradyrhizobium sp. 143]